MPHQLTCPCPPCRYRRGERPEVTQRYTIRLPLDVIAKLKAKKGGPAQWITRQIRRRQK